MVPALATCRSLLLSEEDPLAMSAPHLQFSKVQQAQFEADGFLRLGKLLGLAHLGLLQERLDSLMLGTTTHAGMSFQLDLGGEPGPGGAPVMAPTTVGLTRRTLAHRRVNDLELDPLFREYVGLEVFSAITRQYHTGRDVAIYRAFMMNKPPGQGMHLAWHQDVGAGWGIDTQPVITVWLGLDAATKANGAMCALQCTHPTSARRSR